MEVKIPADDPRAPRRLADTLADLARTVGRLSGPPVLLCIGTDRSTGDCLGPLIGSYLQDSGAGARVVGTLDEPVHATNLAETLAALAREGPPPLVIAVDACLGSLENVGRITVGRGPIRPGAGVNKELPPVGDLYITGVVNVGGFMEYFVLQNTRLGLVMRMARTIAAGVTAFLMEHDRAAQAPLPSLALGRASGG